VRQRLLVLGLLAPLCLAAQMRLFVVEQGEERTTGESYSVGTIPSGDAVDTIFRLRNSGGSSVLLHGLNVAGYRFTFANLPKLPLELAAGASVDFTVRFQPLDPGTYSAYLNINGVRYTVILGTAAVGVSVVLEAGGSSAVLIGGEKIDFGTVAPGSSSIQRLTLVNPGTQQLTIQTLTVTGRAFRGSIGAQPPLQLEPGQTVSFEIVFEPQVAGFEQGTLQVNQRSFTLWGAAQEPVFPKPEIIIEPQTLKAGQQAKLSIRFASASQSSGSGELSMEFTPSVPGKANDPAVQFLASGGRSVTFSVAATEDTARFAGRPEVEFQTGTTAGTVVFTARLGSFSEQATVIIPPTPIIVDSARSLRSATSIEVEVTGFDTSRSASGLSFTFYDGAGNVVAPGKIHADIETAFCQYFAATDFGGIFTLRAVFPVFGNVLKIVAFEAELANSFGTTRTVRTAIQ
jgi:hypothetical protein